MNPVSTFEAIRRWPELNHELVLSAVAKNNLPCLEQALEQTNNPWRAGAPGPETESSLAQKECVKQVRALLNFGGGEVPQGVRGDAIKLLRKAFGIGLLEAKHVVDYLMGGAADWGVADKAAEILDAHFDVKVPYHLTRAGRARFDGMQRELSDRGDTIANLRVQLVQKDDEISALKEANRIWKKGSDESVEAMRRLNTRIENLSNEVQQLGVQRHALQTRFSAAVELLMLVQPFVEEDTLAQRGDHDRKSLAKAIVDFFRNQTSL